MKGRLIMLKSKILPESEYTFKELSWLDIENAWRDAETITGKVTDILADKQILIVFLGKSENGGDIMGILPFSEVTIYPFKYSSNPNRVLPLQIATLKNKLIRVKVAYIKDEYIKLSRKANMLNAIEHIKECEFGFFDIQSLTEKMCFGDIGDGVVGCISIKNVSKSRIMNVCERLHKGDKTWTKILSFNEERQSFFLSYKETFKEYNSKDYKPGDTISCTVCTPVDAAHSGYFVEVTPQVSGIVDANNLTPILAYGDSVECIIKTTNKNGLKLRYLRHLPKTE